MDKLIKRLAPFGVMGIVFIVALTSAMATGLAGAAAFTTAMATLGTGGMIGGIVTLFLHCCLIVGRESDRQWEEEQIMRKDEKLVK